MNYFFLILHYLLLLIAYKSGVWVLREYKSIKVALKITPVVNTALSFRCDQSPSFDALFFVIPNG